MHVKTCFLCEKSLCIQQQGIFSLVPIIFACSLKHISSIFYMILHVTCSSIQAGGMDLEKEFYIFIFLKKYWLPGLIRVYFVEKLDKFRF